MEVVKDENEALRDLVNELRAEAKDLRTAYNEALSTLSAKGLPTPAYVPNTEDGTETKCARKLSAIAAATAATAFCVAVRSD